MIVAGWAWTSVGAKAESRNRAKSNNGGAVLSPEVSTAMNFIARAPRRLKSFRVNPRRRTSQETIISKVAWFDPSPSFRDSFQASPDGTTLGIAPPDLQPYLVALYQGGIWWKSLPNRVWRYGGVA